MSRLRLLAARRLAEPENLVYHVERVTEVGLSGGRVPLSQKCQYAVRAVFELAKRYGGGPVKIAVVASAQAIPARFLENILSELRQAGFVESVRGKEGGYRLSRAPADLTLGEIIRFIEGPLAPVDCVTTDIQANACPLGPDCVFLPIWDEAFRAMMDVYDSINFEELVERDRAMKERQALVYYI